MNLGGEIERHDAAVAAVAPGVEIWIGAEQTFTRRESQETEWLWIAEGGDKEDRARALQEEINQEIRRITEEFDRAGAIERVSLAPKRGQVSVQLVGLGWLPDERR